MPNEHKFPLKKRRPPCGSISGTTPSSSGKLRAYASPSRAGPRTIPLSTTLSWTISLQPSSIPARVCVVHGRNAAMNAAFKPWRGSLKPLDAHLRGPGLRGTFWADGCGRVASAHRRPGDQSVSVYRTRGFRVQRDSGLQPAPYPWIRPRPRPRCESRQAAT